MSPIVRPSRTLSPTIIRVALISSSRVGHVTFYISSRTATRKPLVWPTHPVKRLPDGSAA
jgi:hypothetical protein